MTATTRPGGRARRSPGRSTPAAHAGVDLQMEGQARREIGPGDRHLEASLPRPLVLAAAERTEHHDPRVGHHRTQRLSLCHGRHAERGRPGLERRGTDIGGSVAVGIGLDHGPELGRSRGLPHPADVPAQRAEDRS